jgi:hypothetical protein
MNPVLFALAVAIAVETPIVALVHPGERLRMAGVAAAINVVTCLSMNTVLMWLSRTYSSYQLIGGIGAVLLEATAYSYMSHKAEIGRGFLASAIANAASYGAGLALARTMMT